MKVLVTGGGGFLGRYIIERLILTADHVRSFSRKKYDFLEEIGVECITGDLRSYDEVQEAVRGVDVVYHVAAMAGVWGRPKDFYDINVMGTVHIINACTINGVKKLIYTSSPSAVFGKKDIKGNTETQCPYPRKHLCEYARTQAIAEEMVLDANGMAGMMTIALRPHIIFGPRDNHIIPRIIDRAKKRKLKRIGNGKNLVDIVYVENAADAHILAESALKKGSPVCGNAYFISQGEPVNLWDWVEKLLGMLGAPMIEKSIPFETAYRAGIALEMIYSLLGKKEEPLMTRFLAAQLAKSHYFDITKAREELGYEPKISTDEGLERLVECLKQTGV